MKHDLHFKTSFPTALSSPSVGDLLFGFSASRMLNEVFDQEIC